MDIKDGPEEANLMDAPEMAVTPAPVVGQIRQSPDGANSSVIDATSTCGGGGGGRGSVGNLDNVLDEETDEKPHQGRRKLIFVQPLVIMALYEESYSILFLLQMDGQTMRRVGPLSKEREAKDNPEMTDSVSTAPTPIADTEGRSTKRGSRSQSGPRLFERKRSKSQEMVENGVTTSKEVATVKETREKRVIQEWGSLSRFSADN